MSQSPIFLTKLNDTRSAIRSVVDAIMAAYYSKAETETRLVDHHRFTTPPSATILTDGMRVVPDNAAGTCTYTLPAAPVNGAVIEWRASSTPFASNALVFLRNGNPILGGSNDLTIDVDGLSGRLVWSQANNTWSIDQLGTTLGV